MSLELNNAVDEDKVDESESTAKLDEFNGEYNEEDYIDAPPDGGYGWICAGCVSASNLATWGINGAYSVFLAFYLEENVFPGASPTDFALIGGLFAFFALLLLPLSSLLIVQFGYRVTVFIGIITQIGAYIGASFSTTIGQLYATQGVLMGISSGMIFGANSIVLPSWFLKKRALANGVSHSGVGLGGIVYSLVANALIQRTGDQKWALRVLGFISLVIYTATVFLIKIRIPKNARFKKEDKTSVLVILKSVFDYKVWKSLPLTLVSAWVFIASAAYTICLFSLSNYARSLGYSHHQGTISVVVFNAGQTIGRPSIGLFSEITGRTNFSIIASFYSSILTFVFWINLQNFASLLIFAFMLGFSAGIAAVNVVPLVADVVGLNSFPSGLSFANSFNALGSLIAEVIALKLRDYSLVKQTPYFHCQLFVGTAYFISGLILIPYREWRINRMLTQLKKSSTIDEDQRRIFEELTTDRSFKAYLKRSFLNIKI